MKIKKYEGNPILKPTNNAWEDRCVLNPAVIYDEDRQKFVMLYRAAGNDVRHQIVFGLAESDDGFHFTRMSDKPVFASAHGEPDGGCVEDPRVVKIGDLYYMTYAARAYAPGQYWLVPFVEGAPAPMYLDETDVRGEGLPTFAEKNLSVSYLAVTKDFKTYKKLGRISEANVDDRDVLLFPEKVGGKFVMISRPKFQNVPGVTMPSIWITVSDDVCDYQKPTLLMTGVEDWEVQRMGAGAPPIKTKDGWFMLYHAVDKDGVYRVGAVLLDLDDPTKILARTKHFIMEPETEYEKTGIYNGCVFPTGNVVKDGILYIYYGCADVYVSVATVNFDELVDDLKKGKL